MACDYSQSLGIHQLDATNATCLLSDAASDEERKGFWELFQIGFFFRLFVDKPRTIKLNTAQWKVNFPYLASESALYSNTEPVIFAINSRITQIIADFFDMLESPRLAHPDAGLVLAAVEGLCAEARALYDDWHLVSFPKLARTSAN